MVIRTVTLSDSTSSVVMNKRSQVGITLNRLDLQQMIHRDVVAVMRNMQHYPYPTKPSRSCDYCAYTIICDDAMV